MGERAPTPPGMVVTEHQLAEAMEYLLRDANAFTSLDGVVQHLQSKFGVDLTPKIDFIRAQIRHFLLRSSQPQGFFPQQLHPRPPHFTLNQPPNFFPASSQHLHHNFAGYIPTEAYGFRPVPLPQSSQPTPPPPPPPPVVVNTPRVAPSRVSPKSRVPTARKRRGGPGGLNKLCGVSPELQAIVGQPTMPRTEIVRQLWQYIRKNNLQDPNNKRKIICNDELRLVLEIDCIDMFKMNKLLAKHIYALEQTNQTADNSSKLKADEETWKKNDDPVPIVVISDALASFFGTDEREMSRPEVLRQMWEYIKVHKLEDPSNSMSILCDGKLQELLGCESVSALGMPEMLAERHLTMKS